MGNGGATGIDQDLTGTDEGAPGRRELNKRRTRAAIRDAAKRLFLERGFAQVSVAQIADAAGVTEKTVFNHFATKEDLVYSEMEDWEDQMLAAIRGRPASQTALDAFVDFISRPSGLLAGAQQDHETLVQLSRLILETPSLQAREARTIDRYTDVLADALADELAVDRGDPRAWIMANAMMGVHRAVLDHVRRGIAAGGPPDRLASDVRRIAADARALLGSGIAT